MIMNKIKILLPAKIHPAVMAVWAALIAASHLLPTVPIWGGGSFSLAAALYPLSGIMFGPLAGALCTAVGGFLGSVVAPNTQNMLRLGSFIIWTTTAFTTGCIAWGSWPPVTIDPKGNFVINGGIIIYLIGTVLWFTQEIGRSVILFPLFFYGIGFAALILGSILASRILAGENTTLKLPIIWLCSYSGMIGGATIGNFFSLVLYKLPRETWIALTMAAPLERALFSLGTVLIGAPLLAGLPKTGIFVGPRYESDESLPLQNESGVS